MLLSIKRLLAYWIDFVILTIVLVGLQMLLYFITSGIPFDYLKKGYEIELWVLLSMSFPVWLYFIFCELYKQQTIGKWMLKLTVINVDGSKIKLHQAFIRTFIRLLPWELTHLIILVPKPWWDTEEPYNINLIYIPNILMLLYILVVFATKGKIGVHDYIVKTRVIRSPTNKTE
jgi:uncharacterized RDD family membrane protein YckC